VDPNYGRQGIGKSITEECIKHAKKTNEKTVALHASEIMGKAMGIYQGLGFSVLREL
jgi:ribosomal protein S18 acetylase RimI-like enzyme